MGSGDDEGNRGKPRAVPARFESTGRTVVAKTLGLTSGADLRPAPAFSAKGAKVSITQKSGAPEVAVKFTSGAPDASAQSHIEVMPQAPESRPTSQPTPYRITDGSATLANLKPGETAKVRVVTTGQPTLVGTLDATDGATVDLQEEAQIHGRAGFSEGTPAANTELTAVVYRAERAPEMIPVRTGADGAFTIATAGGRDVLIEISTAGREGGADRAPFVEQRASLDASAPWNLAPVTFEHEEALVHGRVVDAGGAAVAGATVLVLPVDLQTRALSARTEADGRFTVKGPPCRGPLEVFAITEAQAARATGLVAKGGSTDIHLAPAGSVSGRVLASTPALHALVRVELRTEAGNLYASAVVVSDGAFAFPHVPAGRYTVTVAAPDRKSEPAGPIDVPAGGAATHAGLSALPVATDLAKATLRVMDASGAPVVGAVVDVAVGDVATLRGTTDTAGNLEVVTPAGGAKMVSVAAPGYRAHRAAWDGASAITLTAAQ